jgi:arsenite/tail-anchored protein-transporting ATPase
MRDGDAMRDGGAVRIVLTTGKGGVGKTTVAAATAVHAAQGGHRTLVLSTDVAHSLADVLDVPLGHAVVEVAPRLHAQQLDGRRRLEESWSDIQGYLVELLGWAGADAIDAAELSSLPGLDEVFALENLRDHAASGQYDLIVVDCAPTA